MQRGSKRRKNHTTITSQWATALAGDVAELIGRYLGPFYAARARCVCRRWHKVFGRDALWRYFYTYVEQTLGRPPLDTCMEDFDWATHYWQTYVEPMDLENGISRALANNFRLCCMMVCAHIPGAGANYKIRNAKVPPHPTWHKRKWGVVLATTSLSSYDDISVYLEERSPFVSLNRGYSSFVVWIGMDQFSQPYLSLVFALVTTQTFVASEVAKFIMKK